MRAAAAASVRTMVLTTLLCSLCIGCSASRAQLLEPIEEPRGGEERWAQWPGDAPVAPPPPPPPSAPPPAPVGARIAATAAALVGVPLRAAAPHLPDDCTGLVRAAYEREGVDLLALADRSTSSGVTHIFRLARARDALHERTPEPGDLVFFRETYDRNRDGRLNDGYTHVAVVEAVDDDGTVTYVHRGGSGVTRARMNLSSPSSRHDGDGRVINDWLRPRSRRASAAFAAELFAGYGSARALSPR